MMRKLAVGPKKIRAWGTLHSLLVALYQDCSYADRPCIIGLRRSATDEEIRVSSDES